MPTRLKKIARFVFRAKPPYNFALTVHKPAGWNWFAHEEQWERDTVWTGFWFGADVIGIKARGSQGRSPNVTVDVFARHQLVQARLNALRDLLRAALGVNEDIRPLYRLMRRDKILGHLVKRLYGLHEGWGSDVFPSLTLAILLQMAPLKRSQEMMDCVVNNYGTVINFDRQRVRLWPRENVIARLRPAELAKKCRVGYRAKFLVRLAQQLRAGFPSVAELAAMSPEAAKEKLMTLFGVGEYSAGFATPHPSFTLDVWSVKIFHQLIFGRPAPLKDPRSAIERTSRAAEKMWGPWRGYVFMYVLNDLDYLAKKFGLPK